MLETLMVLLAGVIAFFLFRVVLPRRKESAATPVKFICPTCGEKDCECRQEEGN
jgi:hypothetical protein